MASPWTTVTARDTSCPSQARSEQALLATEDAAIASRLSPAVRSEEMIMKNGKCPKCGSCDVYKTSIGPGQRGFRQLSMFTSVKLAEFICCDCGLVESYLDDMNAVPRVKDKCTKVEAKS